jgi:hypothetical protein
MTSFFLKNKIGVQFNTVELKWPAPRSTYEMPTANHHGSNHSFVWTNTHPMKISKKKNTHPMTGDYLDRSLESVVRSLVAARSNIHVSGTCIYLSPMIWKNQCRSPKRSYSLYIGLQGNYIFWDKFWTLILIKEI